MSLFRDTVRFCVERHVEIQIEPSIALAFDDRGCGCGETGLSVM